MVSLSVLRSTNCTDAEWDEYVKMSQIQDNEIPRIERHWSSSCTDNQYCNVNYKEYLKIKQKSNSEYNFDIEYALHRYRLWMQNTIKKVERAREVGKKIRACTIIQRKFIEYYY
ncbi:hypothetical protein Glove_18g77 [Diversispora epigaea]|uniref:Uncharacterized protein n=1 Tax=Diversispora epigaea TaxID=1348612 RepID=A0A397JVB7_9GLOM|nr:hypothetical protein Glove_18g77 [Diversispora epigaea]